MTGRQQPPPTDPPERDETVPESLEQAWRKLDDPEPPALLDQRVLNRARSAVERPRTARPWSFGWIHTLTTAAVIVLGITVLLHVREPDSSPGMSLPAPPVPAERRAEEPSIKIRERTLTEAADDQPEVRDQASPARQSRAAPVPMAPQALSNADDPALRAPETWLEDIRTLIEEGRLDEARESLTEFREVWPDYPVPDDLLP